MSEHCRDCMWSSTFLSGKAECKNRVIRKRHMSIRLVKEEDSCEHWDTLDENFDYGSQKYVSAGDSRFASQSSERHRSIQD